MNLELLSLLVFVGFSASAAPIHTNGQIISFTNTSGRVFENVLLKKIERHGIYYSATNLSSSGLVRFSEMSPSLRETFGYDPALERAALAEERERQAALKAMLARQAAAYAQQLEKDKEAAKEKARALAEEQSTLELKRRLALEEHERLARQHQRQEQYIRDVIRDERLRQQGKVGPSPNPPRNP